jgi:hypothetical protein
MDFNGTTIEKLSRAECLRLLGQVPVGRIVYTRQAMPAVELVNPRTDWSVTIVGLSQAVVGGEEVRRLEQAGLDPRAPGECDHFIRISPAIVNGRRTVAGRLTGDDDASHI